MSQSKRSSSNNCLKVRQTMFQFLKRKKKNQLEASLKQYNDSSNKTIQIEQRRSQKKFQSHNRAKSNVNYDFVLEEHDTIPLFSTHRNRFSNSMNITPKKISFAIEQSQKKQNFNPKSSKKPFLQMISPLKSNRDEIINTESKYQRGQQISKMYHHSSSNPKKSILKPSSFINQKSSLQPFQKRKISNSLNNLKQIFHKMYQAGQIAKEKNYQLGFSLVNLIKDMQFKDSSKQNSINQKLGQIKYILKATSSSLQVFGDKLEADQVIQEFSKTFSQSLNEIQATFNHNFRQQMQQKILNITNQKDSQIDQLSSLNSKLERQVQKFTSKMQKNLDQYQNQIQRHNQRQQNLLQTIQSLKKTQESQKQKYEQQITLLKQEVQQEKLSFKQIQKKLKDYMYSEQKFRLQNQSKIQQQKSVRQQYLLQQVQKLKHEFTIDISNLHTLYQTKQQQLLKKIELLNSQLQKERTERKCDRNVNDRILEEANFSRSQLRKLEIKNQQILRDMYRMNEELYQHWLALKDIKTLSQRLKIYINFERIYKDLSFNPVLFRI